MRDTKTGIDNITGVVSKGLANKIDREIMTYSGVIIEKTPEEKILAGVNWENFTNANDHTE